MLTWLVFCVLLQVILYRWDGSELVGMAFFDAQLSIISMHCIRNYIMFADLYKSVSLIYWEVSIIRSSGVKVVQM